LSGSDGTTVTIKRFHGKVVALGFGYTSCADVCPTTLAFLAEARRELGGAAKDFQVLYVTVDPERDNALRLRKYMDAFDTSFIGATGTSADLADVRKAYGITMTKQMSKVDPNAYQIHHSAFVYLIDRGGNLRAIVPFGATADDMTHDVKALLAEQP
jgi:protein SCO1/2